MEKKPGRPQEKTRSVDVRGLKCPMTFVHAKLALEEAEEGELLEVIFDYPPSARSMEESFRKHGHEVIEATAPAADRPAGRLIIRKKGSTPDA